MPEHLPAPHPDAPAARRPVVPLVDDELPADQDLSDLDEPDDLDDLDLHEWPDDEPLGELEPDDDPVSDLDPLDGIDDEPDGDDLLEFDLEPPEPEVDLGDEPPEAGSRTVVLPWRTTVRLPEHGVEIPAVLDPASPVTTWVGGAVAGPLVVELAGYTLTVDVAAEPSGAPLLRVGRDVLSGRFAVGC